MLVDRYCPTSIREATAKAPWIFLIGHVRVSGRSVERRRRRRDDAATTPDLRLLFRDLFSRLRRVRRGTRGREPVHRPLLLPRSTVLFSFALPPLFAHPAIFSLFSQASSLMHWLNYPHIVDFISSSENHNGVFRAPLYEKLIHSFTI